MFLRKIYTHACSFEAFVFSHVWSVQTLGKSDFRLPTSQSFRYYVTKIPWKFLPRVLFSPTYLISFVLIFMVYYIDFAGKVLITTKFDKNHIKDKL